MNAMKIAQRYTYGQRVPVVIGTSQDRTVSLCLNPQPGSWSADPLEMEQDMGILGVKASVFHCFKHVNY